MRPPWILALAIAACAGPERPQRAEPASSATAAPSARVPAQTAFERLYFPADSTLFEKKKPARPGEWLDRFKETGQSFLRYQSGKPVRPSAERNALVLQPLGHFDEKQSALIGKMREVLAAFFGLPVELAPALPLPKKGQRKKSDGGRTWTQHYTRVLLDEVLEPRVPKNAVVLVGVTVEDLYPDPTWNYVFGQATLEDRVGVYSLARFFPEFWGQRSSTESEARTFAKSAQILVHETAHAFSLEHCTEYECVMNGSNSLEELNGQFGELCPVCLRKLAWNIGFEPKARYQMLRDIYRREGEHDLEQWLGRRLAQLEAP